MTPRESPAWINALRLKRIEGAPLELTELDGMKYPALKEAFKKADEEYTRVSTNYPEMAYELISKPSAVSVAPSEAKAVAEFLGCPSSDTGRYQSRVVRYSGVCYSVSIVTGLCG